jgi:hypothetical protein
MKKMFNEGNQTHNFMSSSGSGTVINYGFGSGSDFLTSYGSGYGSGSTSQKVPVPTVPVTVPTVPVPQHCLSTLDPVSGKEKIGFEIPSDLTEAVPRIQIGHEFSLVCES